MQVILDSAEQADQTYCVGCGADFEEVSRWCVEDRHGNEWSAYCAKCAVKLWIVTDTARHFLRSEMALGR